MEQPVSLWKKLIAGILFLVLNLEQAIRLSWFMDLGTTNVSG
jgi:hypothetical protein